MKKILLFFLVLTGLNVFSQQYRYVKAQLHCHSNADGGAMSPVVVAQEYVNRGYEIVCLTDHNIMTPATDYSLPGLLTINSEEYTFEKHLNGYYLDHTVYARHLTPQLSIDTIRSQGGLVQFNHPVYNVVDDYVYTFPQFMALTNGPDLIEIHNAAMDMIPGGQFKMAIWDSLLMNDRKIWGTSTDDMHDLVQGYVIPTINIGWVMIRLNTLSADSLRAALLRGDFYGSNGVQIFYYSVDGNTINISSDATTIKFIGDWGQVLSEVSGPSASYTRTTEKYVRIELEKPGPLGVGVKYAFTQPVFFDNTLNNSNFIHEFQYNLSSYPNPCNDKLDICFNTENEADVKVEIFDLSGKIITAVSYFIQQKGFIDIPVDVSILSEGIYICSITINGNIIAKKIIKF
jgi:hypothetical protein